MDKLLTGKVDGDDELIYEVYADGSVRYPSLERYAREQLGPPPVCEGCGKEWELVLFQNNTGAWKHVMTDACVAQPRMSEDEMQALLNTMAIWARSHHKDTWDDIWEERFDRFWGRFWSLGEMLMSLPGAWAGRAFGSHGVRAVVRIPEGWWSTRG